MSVFDSWHWSEWDTSFYRSDCSLTDVSFLNADDYSVTIIFIAYLTFVLFCGYVYGRHKGLSNSRARELLDGEGKTKTRLIELSSKIWFLLSTFVFPWYLCIVWLFYSMYHNDFHYVNDFNPWMLSVTVIYCLYSIVIMLSYRYYSHSDSFSKSSIRTSMVYGVCMTVCILFIMVQNEENNPQSFSHDGFYGHDILHCFDLGFNMLKNITSDLEWFRSANDIPTEYVHRNPIILSVLLILYGSITHHLFVTLRVITAKCCDHEYIEKTVEFYAKRKQKRIEKLRKKRVKRDRRKNKRKSSYNPDDGTVYEYDSSTLDDYDLEMSESIGINQHHHVHPKRDIYYLRNPSDSVPHPKSNCQQRGKAADLELRVENVISEDLEIRNPRPMSVYV